MTLMYKFAHKTKLTHFSKQSFGELTPERLDAVDSVHFWAHLEIFKANPDTSQITYLFNILQKYSTLDLFEICQNIVGAATDLEEAFPALNLATEEQFQEITQLGYTNNIWPEDFPYVYQAPLKSTSDLTQCLKDCKYTYRWAKVNSLAFFTLEMVVATGVCLLPGAQVGSMGIVAIATGDLVLKVVDIEGAYSICKAACVQ